MCIAKLRKPPPQLLRILAIARRFLCHATQAFTLDTTYQLLSTAVTHPCRKLTFIFAVLRSAFVAVKDGGITWRGTKYSLAELRKKNL
jgi:hypothetical protein